MFESRATGCPTVEVPTASSDQSAVRPHPPVVLRRPFQSVAASPDGMKLQESLFRLEKRRLFPTLLPAHGPSADNPTDQTQKRKELTTKLWAVFQANPVEDGIDHLGEVKISEALQSMDGYPVLAWLKAFSVDTDHPHFAASVLRCLGRQQRPGTVSWRMGVVRKALSTNSVDIRDAAAQAAESWGGLEMRDVLQEHTTDPVPWLQEYILEILNDIQP